MLRSKTELYRDASDISSEDQGSTRSREDQGSSRSRSISTSSEPRSSDQMDGYISRLAEPRRNEGSAEPRRKEDRDTRPSQLSLIGKSGGKTSKPVTGSRIPLSPSMLDKWDINYSLFKGFILFKFLLKQNWQIWYEQQRKVHLLGFLSHFTLNSPCRCAVEYLSLFLFYFGSASLGCLLYAFFLFIARGLPAFYSILNFFAY